MSLGHKKVIIIGGGISGIKSAIDLYNGGIEDTLILESRSSLGGRLYTITSNGNYYDFGASWFHDSLTNPLFTKALKLENIDYYYDDGKCQYLNSTNKDIPIWKFDSVVDEIMTYFSLTYLNNADKPDISLKDLTYEYIEKFKKRLTIDQQNCCVEVVRMWAELWHGEYWGNLSGKYCFADAEHQGRNVFVLNGYTKVFENELNELPKTYQKNNIKLNTHVSRIDYSGRLIEVTTRCGQVYTCDYLISTIPQTLLKITDTSDSYYIEWKPEIPKPIKEVLTYCNYGSLGKVVFEFDFCFWSNDVERFYILADSNYSYPTLFINYQALCQKPSIIALTQSPLSKEIETMTKDDIWRLFKPKFEQIATSKVQSPKNIFNTEWNRDEFIRGAYGTSLINTINPSAVIQAFTNGFGKIRFAGAETIDGSSNGCAHGGWLSGAREAEYILNREARSKM
ncbi:unnamed protein product [Candida verbasci]|uniref:Amine oxidase domain-containing protein n=1 Tax=Candida verbasci TaxID=1227364 RepID=A0A9W4XEP2_9ASCO|nr:unnamed protein product [Candida verbasci]